MVAKGSPIQANRVQALISKIFSFALDAELVTANPCARLKKRSKEVRATRVLSDEEIRLFWRRVGDPPNSARIGQALRLVLLTGVRDTEMAGAEVKEFDRLDTLGWFPLFGTSMGGPSLAPAVIVLAIMVLPTVAAISQDAFRLIPYKVKEAAYGMGTTKWEAIFHVMIPTAITGIFASLVLGFGRALGETMALAMIIGNANQISLSLFAPANTLAALLAFELPRGGPDRTRGADVRRGGAVGGDAHRQLARRPDHDVRQQAAGFVRRLEWL